MSRWAAFGEEFLKSIGWWKLPDRAKQVKSLVTSAVALAVALGYPAKDYIKEYAKAHTQMFEWLWPSWPYVLALSSAFFAWKAAIAWHKTTGPIIWIGDLNFDRHWSIFDVQVENRGEGNVIARAYAVKLLDAAKHNTSRIDVELELHWRGLVNNPREFIELSGVKHGRLALLQIRRFGDSPYPCLTQQVTPESTSTDPFQTPVLVSWEPSKPLSEQRRMFLDIRVDFLDPTTKECVKRRKMRLSIIPDPSLPLERAYRVKLQ